LRGALPWTQGRTTSGLAFARSQAAAIGAQSATSRDAARSPASGAAAVIPADADDARRARFDRDLRPDGALVDNAEVDFVRRSPRRAFENPLPLEKHA